MIRRKQFYYYYKPFHQHQLSSELQQQKSRTLVSGGCRTTTTSSNSRCYINSNTIFTDSFTRNGITSSTLLSLIGKIIVLLLISTVLLQNNNPLKVHNDVPFMSFVSTFSLITTTTRHRTQQQQQQPLRRIHTFLFNNNNNLKQEEEKPSSESINNNNAVVDNNNISTNTSTKTNQKNNKSSNNNIIIPIGKVLQQTMILDGPEWQSVQYRLRSLLSSSSSSMSLNGSNSHGSPPTSKSSSSQSSVPPYMTSQSGIWNVITGSVQGKRVVGMQYVPQQSVSTVLDETTTTTTTTTTTNNNNNMVVSLDQDTNLQLYQESIAYIPDNISELDAIWTMIQSLSSIHCCRPIIQNIGSSSDSNNSSFMSSNCSHIVILGYNPLAIQLATTLYDAFQYNITIVAAGSNVQNEILKTFQTKKGIQYMSPSIETNDNDDNNDDDDESVVLGFASVINQFDALIDTLGNEQSPLLPQSSIQSMNSRICQNLAMNHNCHIYISTITESQRIILQNGLIFGPNQSKEHMKQLIEYSISLNNNNNNNNNNIQNTKRYQNKIAYFPSPFGFGTTVETLLQKGIILKQPSQSQQQSSNNNNNIPYIRGWSLKDFWEYTTWPRDATTSNTRFGFPTDVSDRNNIYDSDFDDIDDDDIDIDPQGPMISAPPLRKGSGSNMFRSKSDNNYDDNDSDDDTNASTTSINNNQNDQKYVMNINTVNELQQIIYNQMTCIVFISAPFCRTCRYLKPQFVRMARQYYQQQQQQQQQPSTTDNDTASNKEKIQFIKAEASGQIGKDIGRTLGIETVPTFILYKNGRRYGVPITNISRLPSKSLNDIIIAMEQNLDWDISLYTDIINTNEDENNNNSHTGNNKNSNRSKLT